MTYPIIQRELTIHLHNKNWYLRPIEDEEKILGPVDYGWHRFNLYPDGFTFGDGLRTTELIEWLNRFRADKHAAAKDYWKSVYK